MPDPLLPVDTRSCFRPLFHACSRCLAALPPDDWSRPTVAGSWQVRDVVAHMIDTGLRRVSFERDGVSPSPPDDPDLVVFLSRLNQQWVAAARRFSPMVLLGLFDHMARAYAETVERIPLDRPALFPVSWAGERQSLAWFDLGRDFTEYWHHQMQIRDAVGAPPETEPRWLHLVLDVGLRALPHALRTVPARSGTLLHVEVLGPSGGSWVVARQDTGWALLLGTPDRPVATHLRIQDRVLARSLFNALPYDAARRAAQVHGDLALAEAVLRTRSVVV